VYLNRHLAIPAGSTANASTCCGGTKEGGGGVGAPASGYLPLNVYSHKCVF